MAFAESPALKEAVKSVVTMSIRGLNTEVGNIGTREKGMEVLLGEISIGATSEGRHCCLWIGGSEGVGDGC